MRLSEKSLACFFFPNKILDKKMLNKEILDKEMLDKEIKRRKGGKNYIIFTIKNL